MDWEDLPTMDELIHDETESLEQSEHPPELAGPDPAAVEETSAEYLGRWHRLVSTTNWEKGRIISQWRQALVRAGGPVQVYSDEAWSRRVGGVTPQHIGRLRRVYEQFGEVYSQYPGLYWSHFQAALDWDDAEMWLEGAVANGWSVAQMRATRWQTLGGPAEAAPGDAELAGAEIDEDAAAEDALPDTIRESIREVRDPESREPSRAGEPGPDRSEDADPAADTADEPPPEPVRPFARLAPLPQDLADACETFKLAILHHKRSGWKEIACNDVLAALDALKQLALAPPDA